MTNYRVIGLMSGTSLDGLDIICVRFSYRNTWKYQIEYCNTYSYSDEWIKKLKNAPQLNEEQIRLLDLEYGILLGEMINHFTQENKIIKTELDLISSHGHTVFHQPERGITLQIGDGQSISNLTKINVINNFRAIDVSLGGQGAPLVPIGDQLLFSEYTYCLNLGGIANISIKEKNEIKAGDIAFANMVSNDLAKKKNLMYDIDGHLAESGRVSTPLLNELNELPYFDKPFPKSLATEGYVNWFKPVLEKYDLPVEDKLHTVGNHLCIQIKRAIKEIESPILITGGGSFNSFWIKNLSNLGLNIKIPVRELVEYKEALIFALIGVLKKENLINVLSSVTGSSSDTSSGDVFNPNS